MRANHSYLIIQFDIVKFFEGLVGDGLDSHLSVVVFFCPGPLSIIVGDCFPVLLVIIRVQTGKVHCYTWEKLTK